MGGDHPLDGTIKKSLATTSPLPCAALLNDDDVPDLIYSTTEGRIRVFLSRVVLSYAIEASGAANPFVGVVPSTINNAVQDANKGVYPHMQDWNGDGIDDLLLNTAGIGYDHTWL